MNDTGNVEAERSAEVERLTKDRDGWVESAKQYSNGLEFYRDLLCRVGNMFGVEARTSDDGSVQQDVLALKVPDLVYRAITERDFDRAHIESLQNKIAQASADVVVLEDEVERLKAGRNEIIEMCAAVCDALTKKRFRDGSYGTAHDCAAAIRALKEER